MGVGEAMVLSTMLQMASSGLKEQRGIRAKNRIRSAEQAENRRDRANIVRSQKQKQESDTLRNKVIDSAEISNLNKGLKRKGIREFSSLSDSVLNG